MIVNNLLLMKNYSDQDLIAIANDANAKQCQNIVINRDIALNLEMIQKICKYFDCPNVRVSIPIANVVESTIFDEAETQVLKESFELLKQNKKTALFVEGEDIEQYSGYTLEETLFASEKISEWAKMINRAKMFDRSLSPLEKYLYAYELVTSFVYQKEDKTIPNSEMDSRNLVKVLNKNKIVCIGFASMLSELCKRIGVPCMTQFVVDKTGEYETFNLLNHANCKVYIEDDIYGLKGMFNADPSRDATKNEFGKTICHALLTDKELEVLFDGQVRVSTELYYSEVVNNFIGLVDSGFELIPEDILNQSYLARTLEDILINIFAQNAERFEALRQSSVEKKMSEDDLEEVFFESIYDELYRVANNASNRYSAKRLEMLVAKTFECTNLSIEDLFATLIDYGNRYRIDPEVFDELTEGLEDNHARQNQEYIYELSKQTDSVDGLILFNALTNVYYSKWKDESKAISKATKVFDNSSRFACSVWNLNNRSNNHFQNEARELKDTFGLVQMQV